MELQPYGGQCRQWTIKLKKESYQTWLTCGIPEASDSYQQNVALAVAEENTKVWEMFIEVTAQDIRRVKGEAILYSHRIYQGRGG